MLITKISPFSGEQNTRDIDVTFQQLADWQGGVLLQDAMPHLTPDDREFIKTGITPSEWDELHGIK